VAAVLSHPRSAPHLINDKRILHLHYGSSIQNVTIIEKTSILRNGILITFHVVRRWSYGLTTSTVSDARKGIPADGSGTIDMVAEVTGSSLLVRSGASSRRYVVDRESGHQFNSGS
jgi:hypothetical protein